MLENLIIPLIQDGNQYNLAGNNVKLTWMKASNKKIFIGSELNLHGMQGESSFKDADTNGNTNAGLNRKIYNLKVHFTNFLWNNQLKQAMNVTLEKSGKLA